MTSSMLAGLRPVHPGTILRRDVLPALGVSTVVESYVWTVPAVLGLAAVLAGNVLVLRGGRTK